MLGAWEWVENNGGWMGGQAGREEGRGVGGGERGIVAVEPNWLIINLNDLWPLPRDLFFTWISLVIQSKGRSLSTDRSASYKTRHTNQLIILKMIKIKSTSSHPSSYFPQTKFGLKYRDNDGERRHVKSGWHQYSRQTVHVAKDGNELRLFNINAVCNIFTSSCDSCRWRDPHLAEGIISLIKSRLDQSILSMGMDCRVGHCNSACFWYHPFNTDQW